MLKKFVAFLKKEIPTLPERAARWLRYLYFMRFAILLWLFPLVLIWANAPQYARSLVSGIVTPSRSVQYLCASFFLVAASFVALILARIVVIYGPERFGEEPPDTLVWLLAHKQKRHEWIAPFASQLNNLIVFIYFLTNGRYEGVNPSSIAKGIAGGVALAFLFWLAVNAIYYLTYEPPPGTSAAQTLVFPRSWLLLSADGTSSQFGDALEDATKSLSLKWLARRWFVPGYRWPPDGDFYEGQYFSMLAACGFFALYWVLFPLTAPVPVPFWSNLSLTLHLLAALAVVVLVFSAQPGRPADAPRLRAWKLFIALVVVSYAVAIPWLYYTYDAQRFPILALVLILVIGVSWALGGIAFLADRFRVPVVTTLIVLMVVPRLMHWDRGMEAHYLSTSLRPARAALPAPEDILNRKIAEYPGQPLIVVTSTGGGIHSAAWTTAVLAQLEMLFAQDASLKSFHDHVLLLSTVSGGSAGLYDYLRELDPVTAGQKPDWQRMKLAARCSSLEAVGWGLIYYDLPKAFVPALPYIVPPSSGVDDLDHRPLGKDRTWALRRAFARNLDDPFCRLDPGATSPMALNDLLQAHRANQDNEHELTLGNLNPIEHAFPAFTMNTTTVEDGERFLLANYEIPFHKHGPLTPPPAESFLQVYGDVQFQRHGQNLYTDLPLATGAQLSATFPYVSSAAGFPVYQDMDSVHFVDGGYYDNDGTGSAIEFLQEALEDRPATSPKVRIVLIEIRNSPDTVPKQACCYAWERDVTQSVPPWNLVDQLVAPLNAFWGAGHESVTSRNRSALDLLKAAYQDRLDLVDHIVIDDEENTQPDRCTQKEYKTDPLNWSLTPAQQCEVDQSAVQPSILRKYQEAKSWFEEKPAPPQPPKSRPVHTR